MNTPEYQNKLSQVFRYLQSYHSFKNPVRQNLTEYEWSLWLDELPEHEAVIWNRAGADESDEANADFMVKIRRPALEGCPEPPPPIREWLADGWRDPENQAQLRTSQKGPLFAPPTAANLSLRETFAEQPELDTLYQEWEAKREKWRLQLIKAHKALEIYDKFYHLYSQLKRDAERVELVLADGILKATDTNGELIYHPILTQRVELWFDAEQPEFKIVSSNCKPEFNSDLLRQAGRINTEVIGECRTDFETRVDFLYDNDVRVNSYLSGLAARLESEGRFTGDANEFNHIKVATAILKRPILVLRQRTMGFSAFLAQIVADIARGGELPEPLANLLGFETGPLQASEAGTLDFLTVNGESEAVLFAKEANFEQLQIVQKLVKNGAVLVQGPPGTGKTHTIANLVGHFLAQGRTVLVTSHTSKALRVLKEKIAPNLQALCVALFNDEREQLESCVEVITEAVATYSPEVLTKEARELQAIRSELFAGRQEIQAQLLELRRGEYRPITVGEQDYAVKTAAKIVWNGAGRHDWIPSPVRMGSALPMTNVELTRLYQTNLALSPDDEAELRLAIPDLQELWPPEEVERMLVEMEAGAAVTTAEHDDYWSPGRQVDAAALTGVLTQIDKIGTELRMGSLWEQKARAAGFWDSNCRRPWETLIENIRVAFEKNAAYQTVLIDYEPQIPAEMVSELIQEELEAIIAHLQSGKKLNFLALFQHCYWKEIVIKMRLKSALPVTVEHFQFLLQGVQLGITREVLQQRWRKLITEAGGPTVESFGDTPETGMRHYMEKIIGLLDYYKQHWIPLANQLALVGFNWDPFLQDQPLLDVDPSGLGRWVAACDQLAKILGARQKRLKAAATRMRLQEKATVLGERHLKGGLAQVTCNLQLALEKGDIGLYREAYRRLQELAGKSMDWKLRQNGLKKLAPMAPAWAAAIRNRVGEHGLGQLPGEPEPAWEWRQLQDELELRNQESVERLQRRLEQLNQQLRQVTVRLIEKQTWAKICQTSMNERQALVGWKELIKKMGKRTGARAPVLMEEARRLMHHCQAAVPVWIMPLVRVAENFNPGVNRFDVVIIDEASQSDPLALAALYLGKQVVVVGDDQQVSPDAVGQNQTEVQNLINEYLRDIPNRQLYDGQSSVYDLAKCSFEPVCLKEHFRCVAPIIEFSNRLSYEGRIRPLRDASTVAVKPPTVAVRVTDGVASEKVNRAESETVAAILAACLEQPEYAAATFGVISLVGTEQAVAIDAILRRRLTEKEYTKRQILCGNPAQFQGDERDIIFISLVDSAKEDGPLNLRSFGAQEMYRKRYNVAVSRARDQLWVVHSLDPDNDLKTEDLRLSLINYTRNPDHFTADSPTEPVRPLSEMERAVLEALNKQGYQVVPQWRVGTYRIDLVVVDKERKVALECDGEKFFTETVLSADLARQVVLERLGWRFIRIRCSQFYRDPEQTLAAVVSQLQNYQIFPSEQPGPVAANDNSLLERVLKRAAELQQEWSKLPITDGPIGGETELPLEDEPAFDLVEYLQAKKVEIIDMRAKGGDLWIIDDAVSQPVIDELKGSGYRFKYYKNGVNASANRPAWCLVNV
jgi:very-short-patch-repair endonuclease